MNGAPPRRTGRRPVGVLVALAVYAAATATAGLALALAPARAPSPAGSPADGTAGRPVRAVAAVPGAVPGTGGPPPPADAAPARVGTGGGQTSFRPLELLLPAGVAAPVRDSGLHADGTLVIPDDPATVGWWDGGALAGDPYGSVVLAGHVDSARYGLGVMARLRTLRSGDVVQVRAGAAVRRYRVTARRSLPQAELAARSDAFRQDVAGRLVLITCGGTFDAVRHRYQDNLIVYAEPLP